MYSLPYERLTGPCNIAKANPAGAPTTTAVTNATKTWMEPFVVSASPEIIQANHTAMYAMHAATTYNARRLHSRTRCRFTPNPAPNRS